MLQQQEAEDFVRQAVEADTTGRKYKVGEIEVE